MMRTEGRSDSISAATMREIGLSLWNTGVVECDNVRKQTGMAYLLNAYKRGDVEATARIGIFMFEGILKSNGSDSQEVAAGIIYNAARRGSLTARTYLNQLCIKRYTNLVGGTKNNCRSGGPLVGFDGKRILINRKGIFVPVDARLEYVDGINRLTFSFNISFIDDEVPNQKAFEESVVRGIKEWEGEYQVFGGQSLQVKIDVTTDERMIDTVNVIAVTEQYADTLRKVTNAIKTKAGKENLNKLLNQKRSMALSGIRKWSVRSMKVIFIVSSDGTFCDYDEIKDVAKHEFGHTLGLGDLYESPGDRLEGVEKGKFDELDGYYITDKVYNLVMCDHHGMISNNDIEMVVLAFCDNEIQLYQKDPYVKNKISKALGKGN